MFFAIVECILEYEGKFLLIRRPSGVQAGGMLVFPGGKVDYADGEGANIFVTAIKREVLEEVGLTLLDPLQVVTTRYFVDMRGKHVIDTVFYCKLEKTVVKVVPAPDEVPEYFWLTAEEIEAREDVPIWVKNDLILISSTRLPQQSI